MDDKPLSELTYRVIGAAMRVHNALGPGLKEAFYQRGLSLEMEKSGLAFEPEYSVEVELEGVRIGLLYLDHLVEGELVVEEKALSHLLTDDELAQVITYLCATEKKVGLLLNFGRHRLEYKQIFPPRNNVERWRERVRRYVWTPREPPNPLIRSANPLTVHPLPPPLPGSTPRP
jgi:GxxExxY protein